MLNKNTKKLIALGMNLATITGVMPAIISPIPVFASDVAEGQTPFDYAKANLDDELKKVEFSSATDQEDIDSILKDFSYTTTTGTAVTINATTKNDGFSNNNDTCSFTVDFSDKSDTKSFDYLYTYDEAPEVNTNLETSLDGADENQYGTIVTLNVEGCWNPIIIAGVDCSGSDLNSVEAKLNSATSFTGGYKLISAKVVDYVNWENKTLQHVVVQLGLVDKLSTFPLDIASFGGNILTKDGDNFFHDSGWAINGSFSTYDVVSTTVDKSELQTLYNNHTDDTKGNYTDASWLAFSTALGDAKTVIDNTVATQDEVTTANTNLETAIDGLKYQYGTVVTINVEGCWNPIKIAGVDCSGSDLKAVETNLNAAARFTGGYKLISAELVDYVNWENKTLQHVIVKLGLEEKLSEFPLTIASFGGNDLITDGSGIHDSGWGINASMEIQEVETVVDKSNLETLYNKHTGDTQETYTDTSWSTFTTALKAAQTVIDNTDATQDAVDIANTNLETAINGLKNQEGTVTVTTITVDGADTISVSGGSITLTASVSPENATNINVTWSIVSGDNLASLSEAGVLTASKSGNGSVVVKATAKDGSGVSGEKTITISNNTTTSSSTGGGSSHKSSSTTASDTKPASDVKVAETVVKSTDESSIINAIKSANTVVINLNNSNSIDINANNTTLISENILKTLKTDTTTTLEIIETTTNVAGASVVSTIEIKGTNDGQIQFTENTVPITGFKVVGNDEYYLNDNGIMQTGWVKLPGEIWYHLNLETGVKETSWIKDTNGVWYYLDDTLGAMKTGWLNNGGTWYYFNSDGAMATNTVIDGYNIGANGALITY